MKTFREYVFENFEVALARGGLDIEWCRRCPHKKDCDELLEAVSNREFVFPDNWCVDCVNSVLDRSLDSDPEFKAHLDDCFGG